MKEIKQGKIIEWPGGRIDLSEGTGLMGILNVTPDSFSDGGQFVDIEAAVRRGLEMIKQGACIIDIGGESTRPGAKPVAAARQIERVVPVIERLAGQTGAAVSIDTRDAEVAKAAVGAGASIINDVSCLSDERMVELAAEREVPVVLMHMQGSPETMQENPKYEDVVKEVRSYLVSRAEFATRAGIAAEHIFIDPGIGFGKTMEHNLSLLRHIGEFVESGYNVLVGTSRKGFIGRLTGRKEASQRQFGTAATVALCAAAGVDIVRVHDVAEMLEVAKVVNAIRNAE
jgi:dihydropteroate synthase